MKKNYGFLVIDTYLNTVRLIPNRSDDLFMSLKNIAHESRVRQHKTRTELNQEIRKYLNKEYDEEDM